MSATIVLPILLNSISLPSTCNTKFLGLTNILSNSPFPIILSKWSKALKKHSAVEKPKYDTEKHINTFSNVYPSILPNLSNKNIIDTTENNDVAILDINDNINAFLYSNEAFKCIERSFKYKLISIILLVQQL